MWNNFLSYLEGFPAPYDFKVVHGLSLDEDGNRLFVADRENARVLVFKPSTLEFIKAIDLKQYGSVYAVAFCPGNGKRILTYFKFVCYF